MKLQHQGALRLGRYLYLINDFPGDDSERMLMVPWHEELPRERRRRDKQRMKAKARRIFARTYSMGGLEFWRSAEDRERWLADCQKLADHLAHCRRRCCNRARDWEGPTWQERRWVSATKDIDHD